MKATAKATSMGTQKIEITAESPSEIAALKTFERALQNSPEISVAFFQEDVGVLNVSFAITPAEFAQWREAAN